MNNHCSTFRVYSDWTRQRQFDGVKHEALVIGAHVNQSEHSHRTLCVIILYNSDAVGLTLARPV